MIILMIFFMITSNLLDQCIKDNSNSQNNNKESIQDLL